MTALPEGWRRTALGEVAETALGKMLDRGKDRGLPRVSYLRNVNVQWGRVDTENVLEMELADHERERFGLEAGDLLVCEGGEIGRAAIWTGSSEYMGYQKALHRVRPGRDLDSRFLLHQFAFLAQTNSFDEFATGSTIRHLPQQQLRRVPIVLPPIKEQRRIVDILEDHLSHLDAANDYLSVSRTRIRALEDSTVMPRLIPSSTAEVVAGITEGALPDLPSGWRWTTLGDVAAVVGGVTKDAKKQDDPTYVEVPYLRVANVQRARLDLTTVRTIRVRPDQAQALRLQPGDVLMNEGGDRDKLARGWVWSDEVPNCIHQNHVFRARAMPDVVRPEWLAWCSNTYGTRWAQRHGRQSVNLASISLSTLKTMPIPVPPLHIQDESLREIAVRRDALRGLLNAVVEATSRSAALRRSLLEAAFSGRLTGHASDVALAEEMAFA